MKATKKAPKMKEGGESAKFKKSERTAYTPPSERKPQRKGK